MHPTTPRSAVRGITDRGTEGQHASIHYSSVQPAASHIRHSSDFGRSICRPVFLAGQDDGVRWNHWLRPEIVLGIGR